MSTKTDKTYILGWYWEKGLHDARVISISYHRITPDWKEKPYYYNSFEIKIDSTHALFETDIVLIRLYNYKLHSIPIEDVHNLFWYEDKVSITEEGKTNLSIVLQNCNGKFIYIDVDFEKAEVEKT